MNDHDRILIPSLMNLLKIGANLDHSEHNRLSTTSQTENFAELDFLLSVFHSVLMKIGL